MFLTPAEAAQVALAWSSLAELGTSDTPLLAVDLQGATRSSIGIARFDGLLTAMVAPPWVTVALVDEAADPSIVPLVDLFDVVLSTSEFDMIVVTVDDPIAELAALTAAVTASPQASVSLVQLLRLTHLAPTAAALHGESLTYAMLQTGATFQQWLTGRSANPIADDAPAVIVERDGGLLRIALNRPDRRNALNVAMRDQLTEALELLDLDDSLDGALLTGNGSNFCAGGDLDEFGSTPSPAVGHHVRTVRSLPRLIDHVSSRLRVHLHGSCVGAGIEMSAFAHSVIAHPDATFRLPEIGFGLVPGAGGTVSITRRCGRQRMAWMALRGIDVDARTALSWCLIDRIDPRIRS